MTIPLRDVVVFLLTIFLLPFLIVMSSTVLVHRIVRGGIEAAATPSFRPSFIYPSGPLAMEMMTKQMDPVFGDEAFARR
jgi:hypothetical protein